MSKTSTDRRVRWLNSTVFGIGLASLFSDVVHEMATTALPALLASIGASSATLGLIEGLADGLSSFAKLFSGLYSDRLRRRRHTVGRLAWSARWTAPARSSGRRSRSSWSRDWACAGRSHSR